MTVNILHDNNNITVNINNISLLKYTSYAEAYSFARIKKKKKIFIHKQYDVHHIALL